MTDPTALTPLSDLGWSFAGARALSLASRVGLLRALCTPSDDLAATAADLGLDATAVARLVRALCALGVVEGTAGRFAVPEALRPALDGGPLDLGPYFLHLDAVAEEYGAPLEAWLRGAAAPRRVRDEAALRRFSEGLYAISRWLAPPALTAVPGPVRTVLDVGGGLGAWAEAACARWPGAQATVLDRPGVAAIATPHPALRFVGGDYHDAPWGEGWDLVIFASILHQELPEGCAGLFRRAHAALRPGGTVLVTEHVIDADAGPDPFGALLALHMRSFGDVGGVAAVEGWIEAAGFVDLLRRPLPARRWCWTAQRPGG